MLIDFNQEIKRHDGTSIVSESKKFNVKKDENGEWISDPEVNYKDKTLLVDVCKGALNSNLVKVSVEETIKRYKLYLKIENGGKIKLNEEESKILKELVNDKYDLLMSGQILELLNKK